MKGPLALILLLLLAPAASSAQEPPLLFWEASHPERGTLYLLGGLSARREAPGPLAPPAKAAFQGAAGLAVELDLDRAERAALNDQLVQLALLADGERLPDKIPKQLYARVQVALDMLDRPPQALDAFEPWFVGMFLTSRTRALLGYRGDYALAEVLIERARDSKRIEAFETAETVLEMRAGLDDSLQVLMLEKTLDHLGPTRFASIDAAFQAGDVEALQRLFFQDLRADANTAPYYERMVFARNRRMAEQLDALASQGQPWIAVLPVGHLIGEGSLVDRLAERGYAVRRVSRSEPGPAPEPSEALDD